MLILKIRFFPPQSLFVAYSVNRQNLGLTFDTVWQEHVRVLKNKPTNVKHLKQLPGNPERIKTTLKLNLNPLKKQSIPHKAPKRKKPISKTNKDERMYVSF